MRGSHAVGRAGGLVLGSSVNPTGGVEVCTSERASESPGQLGDKADSRPHPGHSDFVVQVGSGLCRLLCCSWLLGLWPQVSQRQWVAGPGHGPSTQGPWSSSWGKVLWMQWAGLESGLPHYPRLQGMKTAPHSRPRSFKLCLGRGESLESAARPAGFESEPCTRFPVSYL